ncbi:hypothetical protein SODALDRAFT_375727 [Sodiomyces alkalinus F11]|uniref:Early meiotic induction protein 1 n=1 Tax=Sodiomyces alkalinus (strain CBS 110278 / VKM F-3762 / F11) TaxID=1314773 RepID=A0A3N2Q9Z0_SODAK|nr:hypothetical protein SODALDRAFT_375727 [Sodiomyces alkalinus F11]ROT43569.1 hypothetical protein SODALDRAFT_375727 [Sodiomyces alkalinus F11]
MGWLWTTKSSSKSPAPDQSAQNETPSQPSSSSQPLSSSSKATENDVDPEIQKFMALFQPDATKPDNSRPEAATSTQTQPPSSPSASSATTSSPFSWLPLKPSPTANTAPPGPEDQEPAPTLSPLAESLLPTEMSCRQAFDMAFYCQSVGGQWNAIYREGSVRSCNDHWADFWACMRIKGYQGPLRDEAVREHYRNKEHAKYGSGRPSSEDVWEARSAKVPPGTAFTTPLGENSVNDEEWQKMELERRRRIRQELGYEGDERAS